MMTQPVANQQNKPLKQRGKAETLALGLWNVRGLKSAEKTRVIKGFAKDQKLHALICVETHAANDQHQELVSRWPNSAWGHSQETKRDGVEIIPLHKDLTVKHLRTTTQGRVSDFSIEFKKLKFTIRVVYAPAKEKERIDFFNNELSKELLEDE